MISISVLGSSMAWVPTLVTDLTAVFDEQLEIRFIDRSPGAAKLCVEWGEAVNRHNGRRDIFLPFTDRKKGLEGADAVIISVSIGGLNEMEFDLAIPEKYGIYAPVGVSVGPAGWSYSLRAVPAFMEFAADFQEVCPKAFVANYTNPMTSLSAVLQLSCGNPSVGLCHAYFETKDVIQKIFGLEDWSSISVSIAGINHFTWVTDFRISRDDGYRLLREKIGNGSLKDVLSGESKDDFGLFSGHELCVELYDAFGYLPYPGDRHTSEFLTFTLGGSPERHKMPNAKGENMDVIKYCNIKRTEVWQRRKMQEERRTDMEKWIGGEKEMPSKSRETGAEMIHAYLYNKPFTDAANLINRGQIPGLPLGTCVETLAVVDGMGVRPMVVDNIPEYLLEIMRPNAVCMKWLTEGVMKKDNNLIMHSLYHDPQCAQLKLHEIRAMAGELIEANDKWRGYSWM